MNGGTTKKNNSKPEAGKSFCSPVALCYQQAAFSPFLTAGRAFTFNPFLMNILAAFKSVKAFVLDVDGVLTNGNLLVLNDGQMARQMSIKDGYALQLAIKKGYHIIIISGGNDEAVKMRLQKLGVAQVHMSVTNKKEVLLQFATKENLTWPQILYMGDDIPDLGPMQMAGVACCPADAAYEVKAISHYISPVDGGRGCVRDVIEKVLKQNNDWNEDADVASR